MLPKMILRGTVGAVVGSLALWSMGQLYSLMGFACTKAICQPSIALSYGGIGGLLAALFFIPWDNPFAHSARTE